MQIQDSDDWDSMTCLQSLTLSDISNLSPKSSFLAITRLPSLRHVSLKGSMPVDSRLLQDPHAALAHPGRQGHPCGGLRREATWRALRHISFRGSMPVDTLSFKTLMQLSHTLEARGIPVEA